MSIYKTETEIEQDDDNGNYISPVKELFIAVIMALIVLAVIWLIVR